MTLGPRGGKAGALVAFLAKTRQLRKVLATNNLFILLLSDTAMFRPKALMLQARVTTPGVASLPGLALRHVLHISV